MDRVVVGEFEKVKVLLPIILSAVNKSSKTFDNCSISSFNLSIALRVIRSRVYHLGSERRKDMFPEAGGELRTLIRKKSVGKPMVAENVFDKQTGGMFSRQLLRARCKTKHLGELVHEYQDTRV